MANEPSSTCSTNGDQRQTIPVMNGPRRSSFFMEDGAWKLDDVYTFRGEFVQAESLNQYFREK